jgi:hypothetical protein
LAVAPGPLMVPAFALLVGPALLKRVGPGLVAAAGSVIFAAGIVWWIAAIGIHADYLQMLPGMLVTGVGVGLTLPTLIAAAVSSLPPTGFARPGGLAAAGSDVIAEFRAGRSCGLSKLDLAD